MLKWLIVLGALAGGGYFLYKKLLAPIDDSWDDDIMYGSEQIHETADAAGAPA